MAMQLAFDTSNIKGFLADDEAEALYHAAAEASQLGPCLEIGSYCGKSTIYLGLACKSNNSVLYALDHHRGSEEHQLGEMFHDPELYDSNSGLMDSFSEFRANIRSADLDDTVIPIVSSSEVASKRWATPLAMVFIDGGHSLDAALCDYRCWAAHIKTGGILAIHDIFPRPEDGGQAPYEIYKLALASGLFEKLALVNSLGLLRRI
jgi:predicted O-methyltransferase YrrM